MKYTYLLCFFALLTACQSTQPATEPYFASEVVEIDPSNIHQYWVPVPGKARYTKRPNWLPKGRGEWTVMETIDSNGVVVERILVSSSPEGFMTQEQLDAMPKPEFRLAATNPNRIPVKYLNTAKILPKSEPLKDK